MSHPPTEPTAGPREGVSAAPHADALNLYIVSPKAGTLILVAARDEAHARSFPPFSNWQQLVRFGSWSPVEGKRTRVRLIGRAEAGAAEGPMMFGAP
jgi:hypothetical protein